MKNHINYIKRIVIKERRIKLQINNKIDMPKTLLVLGNGFDIQCGLKSTYYSFLINVLRINYEKQIGNEITENEVLSKYIEDIDYCNSKFEIAYHYHDLRNNLIIDKLNIWYILLLYKKMLFKKDWNLIENQIMIELTKDKSGYDISEKILLGILRIELAKKYTRDKVRFYYKDQPFRIKENIYQIIAYNISKKCARVQTKINSYSNLHCLLEEWINEVSIKISNQSFMPKVEINELKGLVDSIAEVLLEELKEVEKDFIEYLNKEIIKNTEYIENTKNLIKILIGVNNPFNIISFNYTEPWSTEYNLRTYLNSLQLFINIHGNLLTNNIIFGIDENRMSSDNSGYRFTKVSRIIELYTNDIKYKTPLYSILSLNINKIVFYGHSLAESDYGYFRIIFYEYAKKPDTIFEFCYTVYENTTKENEQRKLRDGISRLFGMYAEESEENKHVYKNLTLNNRIVFRQLPNIIENCQE